MQPFCSAVKRSVGIIRQPAITISQRQGPHNYTLLYQTDVPMTRQRTVTVPNVGGMAGLSVRYSNAKISLGYRADFFFGAIDGGIDARKNETRGFYGPYASLSIGFGD